MLPGVVFMLFRAMRVLPEFGLTETPKVRITSNGLHNFSLIAVIEVVGLLPVVRELFGAFEKTLVLKKVV